MSNVPVDRGISGLFKYPYNGSMKVLFASISTRFLNIVFNFCYLEYLAEITIFTGVPNP